jgi:hypothetical protein
MTGLAIARARDHCRGLLPEHWYPGHTLRVRRRGQQPEEAPFTDYSVLGVEYAEGDVVEIGRSVYSGLLVVLSDDHQFRFDVRQWQRVEDAWRVLIGAQDSEASTWTNLELNAGLFADHLVLPVAEECEMVGVQPAEQLTSKIRLSYPAAGDRGILQQLDGLLGPCDHLLPVLNRFLDQSQDLE